MNKNKIILNEEKRTVVYMLFEDEEKTNNILNKYLLASSLAPDNSFQSYDLRLSKPFIGIAKCHPKDKFNAEIGIAIARKRAEEKRNVEINKFLLSYSQKLRHAANLIENFGIKR